MKLKIEKKQNKKHLTQHLFGFILLLMPWSVKNLQRLYGILFVKRYQSGEEQKRLDVSWNTMKAINKKGRKCTVKLPRIRHLNLQI